MKKSYFICMLCLYTLFCCKGNNEKEHYGEQNQNYVDSLFTRDKLKGTSWVIETRQNEKESIINFTEKYIITKSGEGERTVRHRYYLSSVPPPRFGSPTFDTTKVENGNCGEYMYIDLDISCTVRHIHRLTPTELQFVYDDDYIDTYVRVE